MHLCCHHGHICLLFARYSFEQYAGLRGLLKKDPAAISKLVQQEHVDVLCLQETKLQGKNIEEVRAQLDLPGWSVHWCCSVDKLGYAGVVTLYRESAFPKDLTVTHGLQATEHDGEGRVITLEMPDMYLVNVYVPNSGVLSAESRELRCALSDLMLCSLGGSRSHAQIILSLR
jgi:exonuclease III